MRLCASLVLPEAWQGIEEWKPEVKGAKWKTPLSYVRPTSSTRAVKCGHRLLLELHVYKQR